MDVRIFETVNGGNLVVISRKSAVIFEAEETNGNQGLKFIFEFGEETFLELVDYLQTLSNKSWSNFVPSECNSCGSDYSEYYDRALDNNGYLDFRDNTLRIERPTLESTKLYQFNKKKMESFVYDLKKVLGDGV